MDLVYSRCAAIDVHKRTAVVSVGWADEQGRRQKRTRTFSTMTADLIRLRQWLAEEGVTHVALESTGVYWRPLFNMLEEQCTVILANAAHVKAVPGRKTDVRDSEWLVELLQHGLIRGSFIPPAPIRALRDLTRHRTNLIEDRTRAVNRVQKVLEDANIKLAGVATDLLGVSGRRMLEALVAEETDPHVLAELAKGALRRKRAVLEQALAGRVRAHHRLLLRELLDQIDYLDRAIERLSAAIAAQTRPLATAVELLCTITGVKQRAAETILAEIGVDMGQFPSARHLCSWAAICPGQHESAGKQRGGRTRHGNRWLRRVLLQAAWAATRGREGYLGAQFRRLARRRGEKRAIVAVAHSLLTIIYYVLRDGVPYTELGAAYFDHLESGKLAQYHVRRLAELGYEVTLEPRPAA